MIKSHPIYYPLYTNKDKFIILVTGGRGCEDPDTPILMFDKSVKAIKDIKKGDIVMGDNLTPREVLGKVEGVSRMYKVKQGKGEYRINDNHILTLYSTLENRLIDLHISEALYLIEKGEGKHLYGVRVVEGRNCYEDVEIFPDGIGEYCGMQLDGNQRYLHADGTITHNSGKSFSLGTFIERLTFEMGQTEDAKKIAHQILYTRYTMVSADISVIPEFWEKVEADGTERYFTRTKKDVVNKKTGARVMFRGIKTSSGNQTAKLKSIHGITTFVVDEAEEWTSETEFDTIMFSIRQKGLQNRIMIIMNPTDSNHFIYRKYIKDTHRIEYFDGVPVQISTHPNVLHIHTTYLDNIEHVAEQFKKEANEMKEKNPEKYAHVIMGQWADVAEGAIFKKWGIVDEFPDYAQKVAIGADWGYTNDVTAFVRCGVVGNRLYLDELFYKTHASNGELIAELKKHGLFVYADSADPRLINEINLAGVVVYATQKGGGSIMAGIEKMKDMEIYVTKRSYNLQEELRNYTWAKDKDGRFLNEPIDEWNHACFVQGTMITTKRGLVPIEEIQEGDIVLNSDGWHKVKHFFNNGVKEVYTYTITTEEGDIEVRCTPNHKVKTEEGWKPISELQKGERIYLHKSSISENYLTREISSITAKDRGEENVYNFEVEDVHEYYANGLLVSNCDAARYYVLSVLLGRVMQTRVITKSQLGIY